MGYRELFLVLVSVMLLSVLITQINIHTIEADESLQQLELGYKAMAISQQFIEEAKSKKFDALAGIIAPEDMPDDFTDANDFGPEGSESHPNFDDVDDYHDFSDTLYVEGIDFRVAMEVSYVEDVDPDQMVAGPTFYKRLSVTVSSSWLSHGITLKHVFSYFGANF
jgi:hypothetical protein